MKPRTVIKGILVRLPVVNRLFYEVRYRQVKDENTIRAKIRQVGHQMDLHITQNTKVPYSVIREFEFLLNEMRTREIPIDKTISWALELFLISKYKLQVNYTKAPNESVTPLAEDTFLSVLRERRSVRKWTSETVGINEIIAIIDIAKWAPSSCNTQLWQTLFINRQEDKEFLLKYFHHKFWLHAPLLVVILINTEPYHKIQKHYAYLDGGAFIQNMLLVLHARGYGACWIGFAMWDCFNNMRIDRPQYERFYEYFNLKKGLVPVSMIAVGKPGIKPKAPPRQDTNNIVIASFFE